MCSIVRIICPTWLLWTNCGFLSPKSKARLVVALHAMSLNQLIVGAGMSFPSYIDSVNSGNRAIYTRRRSCSCQHARRTRRFEAASSMY